MPLTILDVVSRHTELTQRRNEWWGCCPYHREKTPSFSVNLEKGVFFCFGCGKAGDAITLLRDLESRSFQEAAQLVGKDIEPPITAEVKRRASQLRKDFDQWWTRHYLAAMRAVKEAWRELETTQIAERYHRKHPGQWDENTVSHWGIQRAIWEAEFYHRQRSLFFWLDETRGQERIAQWRRASHA